MLKLTINSLNGKYISVVYWIVLYIKGKTSCSSSTASFYAVNIVIFSKYSVHVRWMKSGFKHALSSTLS